MLGEERYDETQYQLLRKKMGLDRRCTRSILAGFSVWPTAISDNRCVPSGQFWTRWSSVTRPLSISLWRR